MLGLTPTQLEQFDREGMLCLEGFLNAEQVEKLKAAAHTLLGELDVASHPRTQFKTGDNDHIGDQYFFDSSDKVSYFFDVDAFDENGTLRFPKERAVNKIGHGLHMHSQVYHEVTFDDKVKAVARSLGYKDPRVLQSMLIFKNPVAGGLAARDNEVPPHTDATFLFTKPNLALGFWFALEDCTVENGCLSYLPGTHKTVPVTKRFVRIDGGKGGCNFMDVPVEAKPESDGAAEGEYKMVECPAGSLVLIHNSVLHKSEKNHLAKSRFAYAFHLIDGVDGYDELNWLQVPSTGGTNFSKLYE